MLLAELRIENLRAFGEGEHALVVPFRSGLTALIGENDSGKTTVVDALRMALGMRDQEFLRVEETDFHQPPSGAPRRGEVRIRCKFTALTHADLGAFAEYLTYEGSEGSASPVLYVTWRATRTIVAGKPFTIIEVRSGTDGDGPTIDSACRSLLAATYLRPLRDADRALSAGRRSRLSQILHGTKEVTEHGEDYDPNPNAPLDPATLSVLGIGDFANDLLGKHPGIQAAQNRLNSEYLSHLSVSGDQLRGHISVGGSGGDPKARLRQLLEKLELDLRDVDVPEPPPGQGLGSNNVLFIACELLLLGSEEDAVRLLLIEEPEAHLHPQRQLRLLRFLQERAGGTQIIVTTHSPNLASVIDVESLVLLNRARAFPLNKERTQLSADDYAFLRRFLDVTKANMFFARGVLIVEGDAEAILLPTLARLLGRDLTEHGVSIVNVGGTALGRFARVYQRRAPEQDGMIGIPVACVADLDVWPDCALDIFGYLQGDGVQRSTRSGFRVQSDLAPGELESRREEIEGRATGQCVRTYVADHCTLEYDLALSGLELELTLAVSLAKADKQIVAGKKTWRAVVRSALRAFRQSLDEQKSPEVRASRLCKALRTGGASKATTAQYLCTILHAQATRRHKRRSAEELEAILPSYLVQALKYVTDAGEASSPPN